MGWVRELSWSSPKDSWQQQTSDKDNNLKKENEREEDDTVKSLSVIEVSFQNMNLSICHATLSSKE